jgi:hypothetical protein
MYTHSSKIMLHNPNCIVPVRFRWHHQVHDGDSIHAGHYFSVVNIDGALYRYNDDKVTPAVENDLLSPQATLLILKRVPFAPVLAGSPASVTEVAFATPPARTAPTVSSAPPQAQAAWATATAAAAHDRDTAAAAAVAATASLRAPAPHGGVRVGSQGAHAVRKCVCLHVCYVCYVCYVCCICYASVCYVCMLRVAPVRVHVSPIRIACFFSFCAWQNRKPKVAAVQGQVGHSSSSSAAASVAVLQALASASAAVPLVPQATTGVRCVRVFNYLFNTSVLGCPCSCQCEYMYAQSVLYLFFFLCMHGSLETWRHRQLLLLLLLQ